MFLVSIVALAPVAAQKKKSKKDAAKTEATPTPKKRGEKRWPTGVQ